MLLNSKESKDPSGPRGENDSNSDETRGKEHKEMELQKERDHVSKLSDQLSRTISSLQRLDEKSVIWPETEERWAIKEEVEVELAAGIERLERDIPFLEKEVQRSKKNLQQIKTDSEKLNHQEPRESYSQAEEAAKKEYFAAVGNRNATTAVLTKAQMVLDTSRRKKFPASQPRRQFPFPGAKPGDKPKPSQSTDSQSHAGKLDDETAGLISLGPLMQEQE